MSFARALLVSRPAAVGVLVVIGFAVGALAAVTPDATYGLAVTTVVVVALGTILWRLEAPRNAAFAQVLLLALGFRCLMALVNLAVSVLVFKGATDSMGYIETAEWVGTRMLAGNFEGMQSFGAGLSGFLFSYVLGLFYLLVGASFPAQFIVSSLVALIGVCLLYSAFAHVFPDASSRRFVAAALFFMPSSAYWMSSVGKEAWISLSIGLIVWGFVRTMTSARVPYVLAMAAGFMGTLLVRPAVGAVLLLAVGVGVIVRRPRHRSTAILWPVMLLLTAGIAVAAFDRISSYALLDRTTAENAAKGIAYVLYLQHVGLATDPTAGGSSLGVELTDSSLGGIISYLPLGIFTFLFRPLIFEAHNAVALVAAIESSFLFGLVLWRWRNLFGAFRLILSQPLVTVCLVAFAGLTVIMSFEANFGAIVRHRTMVLPFLLMLLGLPRDRPSRPCAPGTDVAPP